MTKPPKILVFAQTYPSPEEPNAAVFIHRRARQLDDNGYDVQVFTRRHITFGTYLSAPKRVWDHYARPGHFEYQWEGLPVSGFRVHLRLPLNYSRSAASLTFKRAMPLISRLQQQHNFNLFQLATWGDFSLAGAWAARELGVPYVAAAIGGYVNHYYDRPGTVPHSIMRQLFPDARLVVCVSDDLANKVEHLTGGRARTMTFYSGVPLDRFQASLPLRENYRGLLGLTAEHSLVITVGRLGRLKGIYELLAAFSAVLHRHPEARLALVGPLQDEADIRRTLTTLGIAQKVIMVGAVQPESIPGYLNAADIFAFPSYAEGLPNAVLEAGACGLPVVASSVGGIPEIIEDGVHGLLVAPKQVAGLQQALDSLLANRVTRASLAANLRKRIEHKFDYQRNGQRLANTFREIISEQNLSQPT